MKSNFRPILALVAIFVSGARATVPSSTTWVQYVLSSNPQTLTVPFVFQNASDLLVLDSKASPPVTLVLNSDYSVSGGAGSLGTVVTKVGGTNAVQVGDVVTISRAVPLTQTTNFANGGPLTASMIGQAFDKATEISQQLNLVGGNSLRFPGDEALSGVMGKSQRAGNLLGFAANGQVQFFPLSSIIFPTVAPIQATSIAALKSIVVSTVSNNYQIQVAGYYAANDGGGGVFVYNSSSSATDDGGSVIAPTSGSGRWLRSIQGPANVRYWGAKGDGATDDSVAIQAALNYVHAAGGGVVLLPPGNFFVNTGAYVNPYFLSYYSNTTVQGAGSGATTITCTNGSANTSLFGSFPPGGNVNYESLSVFTMTTALKGVMTITLSTAGQASNFTVGDFIYIRGGTCDGTIPDAEINICTSRNTSTGVIGLKWPLSKTYTDDSMNPYGAVDVQSYTGTRVAFNDLTINSNVIILQATQIYDIRLQRVVSNMTMTGSADYPNFATGYLRRMIVQDCDFFNATTYGNEGTWQVARNTNDVKIDNCDFWTAGSTVLQFTEGSVNCVVTNSRFYGTGPLTMSHVHDIMLDHDYFNLNVPDADNQPTIFMGSSSNIDNCVLQNSECYLGGTKTGIFLGGTNNQVSHNTIYSNCGNTASTSIIALGANGNQQTIVGNTIYALNALCSQVLRIGGTSHQNIVSNNVALGASASDCIYVVDTGAQTIGPVIANNSFNGFTGRGIVFENIGHESPYVVAGNLFVGVSAAYSPVAVGGWIASGNTIQSPQGAQIQDNGSGSVALVANNSSQGVTLTAQTGGTVVQKVASTAITTASSTGLSATGLKETATNFAGTVTLSSGAGTVTSAAISSTSTVILTLSSASGANSHPQVTAGSGSATVTGLSSDNGTYNWRLIQ